MGLTRVNAVLALVLLALSMACSSQQSSVSWQCDEQKSGGKLDCKRVGGEAETKTAVEDERADITELQQQPASAKKGKYIFLEKEQQPWRQQLPQLSEQPGEYNYQSSVEDQAIEIQPRVAEPIEVEGVQVAVSQPSPVIRQVLSPTAELVAATEKTPAVVKIDSGKPLYTVQLGAFQTEQDMHAFAKQKDLTTLDNLLGHRTLKGEKQWYVITWGRFASAQLATSAWQQQQESYPKVEYWVRTVGSLDKVKKAAMSEI